MEGKNNEPYLSGPATKQKEPSSRRVLFHPGMLPSTPPASNPPPPAAQTGPSLYQMPLTGYEPTHPETESEELSARRILPSMQTEQGYSHDSPPEPRAPQATPSSYVPLTGYEPINLEAKTGELSGGRILPLMPKRYSPDSSPGPPAPPAAPPPGAQMPLTGYEQSHPKTEAGELGAGRILPSMPERYSQDSSPEPPAPQAGLSRYDYRPPGYEQTPGYDVQPSAAHAQTEPGDHSSGGILPSMPTLERDTSHSPPPAAEVAQSPDQNIGPDQLPVCGQPPAIRPNMEPGDLDAGGILPSMSSQARGSSDSPTELPPPQLVHSPYDRMPLGYQQTTTDHAQPPSTHPRTEPGEQSAGGILPSMPSEGNVPLDSAPEPEPPAPQAVSSAYASMPSGFTQNLGYVQQPLATYPQTEPGGLGVVGIMPSSSPLGHPPYSAGATAAGPYPTLDPSAAGIPPLQPYPRYAPYQSTYGYPYGTNASMPYSSHVNGGSQPGFTASGAGGNYAGIGIGPTYGGATQTYPHYGSGYPQQYPASAPYDYHGLPSRGQARYKGNRSYAAKPGKPYFKDKSRSGPDGANLFVFHIPNDMTNEDMYKLFQPHGNILSARIMTERDTGRGRGFGFVSYDTVESAANAIHFLNGFQVRQKPVSGISNISANSFLLRSSFGSMVSIFCTLQIQGKRLKVQHKQVKESEAHVHGQGRFSLPGYSAPVQEYARHPAPRQRRPFQPPVGFVPVQKPVPVQEYAGPPEPTCRHELTPVLPSIDSELQPRLEATPPLPQTDEPHRGKPTPTLPPVEALDKGNETGDYEGVHSYTTPPCFPDMKDIGKSLPDPE